MLKSGFQWNELPARSPACRGRRRPEHLARENIKACCFVHAVSISQPSGSLTFTFVSNALSCEIFLWVYQEGHPKCRYAPYGLDFVFRTIECGLTRWLEKAKHPLITHDSLMSNIEDQNQLQLQLLELCKQLPEHVQELKAAFDLGRRMAAAQSIEDMARSSRKVFGPTIKEADTAAAFIEGGRFASELDAVIASFTGKFGDSIATRRRAAGSYYQLIGSFYSLPGTKARIRIYRRFGESPYRDHLIRTFGVAEVAMLVACSDEVVEAAIEHKWSKPDLTREQLREFIDTRPQ